MFKKLRKNEKGFTLAELLIVVAIIGVLVAISIPIFTSQLEKARVATDEANVRSWYAEQVADYLTADDSTTYTWPKTYTGPALVAKGAAATPGSEAATTDADAKFYVDYSADYNSTSITIGQK